MAKKQKIIKNRTGKCYNQYKSMIGVLAHQGISNYKTILTQKQFNVLGEWIVGKSQWDIAKTFKLHQTSIHKALFGNVDYSRSKRYGGIFHKIDKFNSNKYQIGKYGYLKIK